MRLRTFKRVLRNWAEQRHTARWHYREMYAYARSMLKNYPEFRNEKRIDEIVKHERRWGRTARAAAWTHAWTAWLANVTDRNPAHAARRCLEQKPKG